MKVRGRECGSVAFFGISAQGIAHRGALHCGVHCIASQILLAHQLNLLRLVCSPQNKANLRYVCCTALPHAVLRCGVS